MPRLVHVGLAIALIALIADLAIHVSPAPHVHTGFRPEEHIAHLGGLIAMVVVLAGVLLDAARLHRTRKEESHAHR